MQHAHDCVLHGSHVPLTGVNGEPTRVPTAEQHLGADTCYDADGPTGLVPGEGGRNRIHAVTAFPRGPDSRRVRTDGGQTGGRDRGSGGGGG